LLLEFSIFRFQFSIMFLGDYRVEIIPDTEFRLDGGAMFGVVPRVLWERVCPPDELNRIKMNANCLFIDTGRDKILVETGIGEKWTERETSMYGITRRRPFAEALSAIAGCRPEDITIVVNTHLHFDHAGGNTLSVPPAVAGGLTSGSFKPQFSTARYLVSKSELDHAEKPHERDRASYLPENWRPMHESGQLELMPDAYEVVEGLRIELTRGHSETMQTVRLERGGRTLYGFSDLVPTRHHLPPAWIAGFDLYPVETLEFKKRILPQAARENWICLFYHDTDFPLCVLDATNNQLTARKYVES
jgi:glyoxylase-like metal-dependent hydrolase (beta-lactamase superfamily II)